MKRVFILALLLGFLSVALVPATQDSTPTSTKQLLNDGKQDQDSKIRRDLEKLQAAGEILSTPKLHNEYPANPRLSATGFNVILVDIIEGGHCTSVAMKGNHVFTCFEGLLTILDAAVPTNPVKVSNYQMTESIYGIDFWEDHAYLMDHDGTVWVLDVADPAVPVLDTVLAGVIAQSGEGITLYDHYAYACRGSDGLYIYDASTPSQPVQVGHFPVSNAKDVAVQENLAYLAGFSNGVRIIDVADKTNPTEVGHYDRADWIARSIEVDDDYVYVTSIFGDDGLWVIDVSDSSNPFDVGYYHIDFFPADVAVGGDYAYVTSQGDQEELAVIDISDPANPNRVGGEVLASGIEVALAGSLACVATEYKRGLSFVSVASPSNPVEIHNYPSLGNYNDIETAGDFLALARGNILTMMEIDSPENQYDLYIAQYSAETFDVEVQGTYAYLGSCDSWYQYYHGLAIVDIFDPANPVQTAYLDGYCIYNLTVEGDYVYFTTGSVFHVVDVSNHESPVVVGSTSSYWARGLDAKSGFAYLAAQEDGLRIMDVSTPSAPVEIGYYDTSWFVADVAVSGEYAYLAGNESGSNIGLRIVDVSTPSSPVEVGSYDTDGATTAIVVSGHHVYISGSNNNRVRIIDVANPANPQEVGYYETGWIEGRVALKTPYIFAKSYLGNSLYILQTDLITGTEITQTPPFALQQNYPNPFCPGTVISYTVPEAMHAELKVFDVGGRFVRTLVDGDISAGTSTVSWDGTDKRGLPLASGIYFYRLEAGDQVMVKKMVLIR